MSALQIIEMTRYIRTGELYADGYRVVYDKITGAPVWTDSNGLTHHVFSEAAEHEFKVIHHSSRRYIEC